MKCSGMTLLAAVVILCSAALAGAQQDVPPLSDKLPADSLIYVGWGGAGPHKAALEKTGLGQLLNDPQVRPHMDAALRQIEAFLKAQSQGGMPPGGFEAVRSVLLDIVVDRPWAISLIDFKPPEPDGKPPVVEAVLLVDLGEQAARLNGHVQTMLNKLMPPAVLEQVQAVEIGGVKLSMLQPEEDAPKFLWGLAGRHLVAAVGEAAATRTLAQLKAGAAGALSASPQFAKMSGKVGPGLLNVYLDVARFRKDLLPLMLSGMLRDQGRVEQTQKALDAVGLSNLDAAGLSLRADGADFVQSTYLLTPRGKSGLFVLADQKPLTTALLGAVPADATFAIALSVNRVKALDELERQLAKFPEAKAEFDKSRADFEKATGLSLRKDLAEAVGDGLVIYNAPSTGGFLVTGVTIVAEVRDPERLREAMMKVESQLLKMIKDEAGDQEADVIFQSATHDGVEYRYVVSGTVNRDPFPVAPAWCIAGKRLIFSVYPQMLRGALNQMKAGRDASLLGNQEFLRNLQAEGNGACAVVHVNTDQLIRISYPALLPLWQVACSMAAEEGIKLDVNLLPSQEKLIDALGNDFAAVVPDDEGVKLTSRAPIPIVSPGQVATMTPVIVAAAVPALAKAREAARRSRSMVNLRGLGNTMMLYRSSENDQYPPDLKTLVDKKFVAPEFLVSVNQKGVGDSYIYVRPAGGDADSWKMVLVYERPENYDNKGTIVLFRDGHVEWMELVRFNKALADTLEANKKASEPME